MAIERKVIRMYNEVIYLVTETLTDEVDEYGDKKSKEVYVRRFAKFKSVSQSEFYQAQTAGMKPEIKLEMADFFDYDGQQEVVYEGMRYKVLRTYRTTTNGIELTLYGGVRDVSTEVSD